MLSLNIAKRLGIKGGKYSIVGISTYLLDLFILVTLVNQTDMSYWLAAAGGFAVGITVNFTILYYWVYKGTDQTFGQGYIFFIIIALASITVISYGTATLVEDFGITLIVARSLVGIFTGTTNFLINTFFNFKQL